MFALYLLLAVAGFAVAVPATLQIADGAVRPRFTALNGLAFFALTAGIAGIVAQQFDISTIIAVLTVVPLGVAGGLLHFEMFQALARRNGHPLAEVHTDNPLPIEPELPLPEV